MGRSLTDVGLWWQRTHFSLPQKFDGVLRAAAPAHINAEMQMRWRRDRVAGIAHGPERLTGEHEVAGLDPLLAQMRVVDADVAEQRLHPDHVAADASRLDACDEAVRRCEHGCAAWSEDVHAAMLAAPAVAL